MLNHNSIGNYSELQAILLNRDCHYGYMLSNKCIFQILISRLKDLDLNKVPSRLEKPIKISLLLIYKFFRVQGIIIIGDNNFNRFLNFFEEKINDNKNSFASYVSVKKNVQKILWTQQKDQIKDIATMKQDSFLFINIENINKCICCRKHIQINQNQNIKTLLKQGARRFSIFTNSYDQFQSQQILKQKICALLNDKGGSLLIISKQNEKDQQIIPKLNYLIKKIIQQIVPNSFDYQIDRIKIIQKNNSQLISADDKKQQKQNSIIRINFIPQNNAVIYCVLKKCVQKIEQYKYLRIDNCYFMDKKLLGQQNDTKILKNSQKLYQILQNRVYKELKKKNHLLKYHKIAGNHIKLHQFENQPNQQGYQYEQPPKFHSYVTPKLQSQSQHTFNDDQPNPKYKNQSIIVLSTISVENNIPKIIRILKQKKMHDFLLIKPYSAYAINSIKSNWFISHTCAGQTLRQIIAEAVQNKKEIIACITCTKYIIVENKAMSHLKRYFNSYLLKHNKLPQGFLIATGKYAQGQQLFEYYMKFQTYQQSVFTFIVLDSEHIRCFLIKQKQYKKQQDKTVIKGQYINLKQYVRKIKDYLLF